MQLQRGGSSVEATGEQGDDVAAEAKLAYGDDQTHRDRGRIEAVSKAGPLCEQRVEIDPFLPARPPGLSPARLSQRGRYRGGGSPFRGPRVRERTRGKGRGLDSRLWRAAGNSAWVSDSILPFCLYEENSVGDPERSAIKSRL